jgi:hypothetical protein
MVQRSGRYTNKQDSDGPKGRQIVRRWLGVKFAPKGRLSSPNAAGAVVEPSPLNWTNWKFPALVALLTVGVGLFAVFALPNLLGDPQWLPMGDATWTVQSAQFVSFGGLGSVYSINAQFLPLPGFLLLLAPAVALGNHLHYLNSYPYALHYPTMWIVVAPVFLVTGSMSILGADYLADTLAVSKTRRRFLAVAIALVVVLPTCVWAGHPEDLLALGLSCFSVALLLRRRYMGASIGLAFAIMMQPWALLLIPILVVATPRGRRLRVVVGASALPAMTGLMLLITDFHDAYRSLVLQPMQGNGQRLPWWRVAHPITIIQYGVPMIARVGSAPRSLAVVTAVAVALAVRRDIRPQNIMLAASVALVARGAFETQIWCWYLAPAAVFLALSVAAWAGISKVRWAFGALSALALYGFAAAAYEGYSLPSVLGLGLLLVTATGALAAAAHGLRPDLGADLAGVKQSWRALSRPLGWTNPSAVGVSCVRAASEDCFASVGNAIDVQGMAARSSGSAKAGSSLPVASGPATVRPGMPGGH